jgi:putative ABC transport system permease protein
VIALGLGTLVVVAIVLLDGMLGRAMETALPARAPSVFLLDVQPDQWPEVAQLGRELGATRIDSVPVVMARLLAVDGRDVPSLLRARPGEAATRQREQWVLTREQRISWMQELPEDNRLVQGSLWSDPERAEVSVEEGFAGELGARLGSVLRFDVQGVVQELTVTSIRTIAWRSFAANFFLVAEPGVLDEAPHFRLGALRLPEPSEQPLQDRLAASLPNVTVLRVRSLLAEARGVLAQVAAAIRLVGGFAVLTGLVTLAGAVMATQARRAREAALWKALGLTRRRVALLFAVEYALSGAVAGLVGAGGAYLLALAVARWLLSLQELPSVATFVLAVGATSVLATCAGLLASAHALRVAPVQVLRGS